MEIADILDRLNELEERVRSYEEKELQVYAQSRKQGSQRRERWSNCGTNSENSRMCFRQKSVQTTSKTQDTMQKNDAKPKLIRSKSTICFV